MPALVAALALLATGCAERAAPVSAAALGGQGALRDTLEAAADEAGVPVEVLAAAAYSETRLRHVEGEKDGHGLFQLDAAAIERASALLGVPAAAIARDPRQNARAFAHLLALEAGDAGDLDAWTAALVGVRTSPAAGEALASGARLALERGFVVDGPDGTVTLPPSPLAQVRQAARPDSARARWVASPNYTNAARRRGDVDTVVIHVTQGSYGGAISWFQNRASQVSSHYVIRSSDGQITQMVEEQDVAWHARNWNGRSIGIEHEGWVDDRDWFTDEMYRASAALTREICDRWGIPKDRQHIRGHVELPGNDHTDPGRHWDWNRYMALVRGEGAGPPTGRLLGFVREGDIHNEAGGIGGATVAVEGGPNVRTDERGFYAFEGLRAGAARVRVSAAGFEAATLERDVQAGGDTWGSVALERAAPPPPPPDPDAAPPPPPPPPDAAVVEPDAALGEPDAAPSEPDAGCPPGGELSTGCATPPPGTPDAAPPPVEDPPPDEDPLPDAGPVDELPPNRLHHVRDRASHEGGCGQSPATDAPAVAALALLCGLALRPRKRR